MWRSAAMRSCDGFIGRLGPGIEALRAGRFDLPAGRPGSARPVASSTCIPTPDRSGSGARARPATGALVVADPGAPQGERRVHAGEIVHLRLAPPGDDPGHGV